MSVIIKGHEYITVAERLSQAKQDVIEIHTEVLQHTPQVVVKATVYLKNGNKANGISAANPSKLIEKMSPYEVAETSAVGRALGFLGYGALDSIATADEVIKADIETHTVDPTDEFGLEPKLPIGHLCTSCGAEVPQKVKEFSTKVHGRILCYKCQMKEKKK